MKRAVSSFWTRLHDPFDVVWVPVWIAVWLGVMGLYAAFSLLVVMR